MIKTDLKDIVDAPSDWSEVFDYREDLKKLSDEILKITKEPKNVIVVGNGGSITSFDAFYHGLCSKMEGISVWTMDPFYLQRVKKNFSPENTIVVAVSKSGNTLGQIETLLYFKQFPIVAVTNFEGSALLEMSRAMGWHLIEHPAIGGRFSGGTSSTLVSCALCGIDVNKIQQGIDSGYKLKNDAYSLAKYYYDLEQKGFNEVYVTCYSEALAGFENLIVQLMHESVCKEGKGQTFYFSMGPEAQHHTNQRFLGGKKNVCGTFIVAKKGLNGEKINVPEEISQIDYKGQRLSIIDGISYQEALMAEYMGTKQDADQKDVPNVTIELDEITAENLGSFVSFWHLVAFYSAVLRGVDPFNQPAVEDSKNITLKILEGLKAKES